MPTLFAFLDAIEQVESGGKADAIHRGDQKGGGDSIGPMQIGEPYWLDSGLAVGGEWSNCAASFAPLEFQYIENDRARYYSRLVVIGYLMRYAPAGKPLRWAAEIDYWEPFARIHNGGPNAWNPVHRQHAATTGYWAKVRAKLAAKGDGR